MSLLQRIARTFCVLLVLGLASGSGAALQYAYAQTAGPTQPSAQPAAPANAAPNSQAAPADPHIDKAQIAQRLNRELDFNLETTTAGWQHALDRVDGELARPRLRYTELNRLRDELQHIRAEVADSWSKIQPRLDADRDQIKLLGAAPAAGAPPEPEQAARNRAELNYHLGLLSAAEATVNSSNLRIDNLLDKIQDVRRKNFTSALFQPIPGLYAYDTWANVPQYIPDAAHRVRDLVADWWADPQNRGDFTRTALEALLILLVLSVGSWRGIRRLRRWQDVGEPPYWRRASSAAGVILLRALPVVAPAVFLYAMIASTQALPERLDWLFYLITQSIVIVFIVGALVTTAFAPRAPQWRLIAMSDARAARICGLILLLAFFYSLASLLYGVTRLVQAPFALTIAVALPSSLLLSAIVDRPAAHDRRKPLRRGAVRARVPGDPNGGVDHRRRHRRVCALRVPAVGAVSRPAIDRHRLDPCARLSAAALGRRLRAGAGRRRQRPSGDGSNAAHALNGASGWRCRSA